MYFVSLIATGTVHIILMFVIIFASLLLGWGVKYAISFIFKKAIAEHKIDTGVLVLVVFVLRLIILMVGFSYAASFEPSIKSVTTSLLASAGIATAVVGFASKDVLSNIVSGAMIIIFRPFTIGHWIKVGLVVEGHVEEIKMLYTVIRDVTNRRLIIPNSKIVSSDVINSSYHDENVMLIIDFPVSYESDIDKVKGIIQEVAEANPLTIDKRSKAQKKQNAPIVEVAVSEFDTYSMQLGAVVWIADPKNAVRFKWMLNEAVRKRLNKEGIQFPYPNLIVRELDIKK